MPWTVAETMENALVFDAVKLKTVSPASLDLITSVVVSALPYKAELSSALIALAKNVAVVDMYADPPAVFMLTPLVIVANEVPHAVIVKISAAFASPKPSCSVSDTVFPSAIVALAVMVMEQSFGLAVKIAVLEASAVDPVPIPSWA